MGYVANLSPLPSGYLLDNRILIGSVANPSPLPSGYLLDNRLLMGSLSEVLTGDYLGVPDFQDG